MIAYLELNVSGETQQCKDVLKKHGARDLYYYAANGVEEHHMAVRIGDDHSWNEIVDDLVRVGCKVPQITRTAHGHEQPNMTSGHSVKTFQELFMNGDCGSG